MADSYTQLFATAREEAPTVLAERIHRSIVQVQRAQARLRLAFAAFGGAVSGIGLGIALPSFVRAASENGFVSYVRLFASDSDLAFAHLGTFITPVFESLPGVEATVTLFLTAILLVSGAAALRAAAQLRTLTTPYSPSL